MQCLQIEMKRNDFVALSIVTPVYFILEEKKNVLMWTYKLCRQAFLILKRTEYSLKQLYLFQILFCFMVNLTGSTLSGSEILNRNMFDVIFAEIHVCVFKWDDINDMRASWNGTQWRNNSKFFQVQWIAVNMNIILDFFPIILHSWKFSISWNEYFRYTT
jgi:hypothetical protein